MTIIEEPLPGLLLLKPTVFEDNRGYFFESYNQTTFNNLGITCEFSQDNQSLSVDEGVLRGLHFQKPPFSQAKLVRAVLGAVYDVVVDIRTGSPTYGKHFGAVLDSSNKHCLFIPEGFAHGFVTLAPNTLFTYKCSDVYNKDAEGGILWNDKDLGIDWNIEHPILSEKDKENPGFDSFKNPFVYK